MWQNYQHESQIYSTKPRQGQARAQANHSVLDDIEQYRRNCQYLNIVQTMKNHSGLTKTFLDQLIMKYLNLRFYCYIMADSVNRISVPSAATALAQTFWLFLYVKYDNQNCKLHHYTFAQRNHQNVYANAVVADGTQRF